MAQNEMGHTVLPVSREILDGLLSEGPEYGYSHTDDPDYADVVTVDPGTYGGPVAIIETGSGPFHPVDVTFLRSELKDAFLGFSAGHRCWEVVVAVR